MYLSSDIAGLNLLDNSTSHNIVHMLCKEGGREGGREGEREQ
jgi:hypothetical protein